MNRNFYFLLAGQSLANIGDVLYVVSIIHTIFILTGSAAAASFVPFTVTSSMFIAGLLTPLLIDKVNLKWLLAGSQIGKTILLVLLGFMMIGMNASNVYWMFLMISLIAFLDGCANPIRQTLIPHYVEWDQLIRANGMTETATQFIQASMWFAGSFLLLLMGASQLIWLVGGLFTLASILLCFMESISHEAAVPKGRWEQIKEGWVTLSRTPVLKRIAWMDGLETMAGTVWIAAILYVFVSDALHTNETWWGFINSAFLTGMILGSLYCMRFSTRIENRLGAFILTGSIVSCLVTLVFSVNPYPAAALILSFCLGIFGQLKNIPQQTIIQSSVPKEQLSTVYTSLGAIGTGIFGIGSLIVGILADLLGIRAVFMISGLLLAGVSVIVYKNRQLFER